MPDPAPARSPSPRSIRRPTPGALLTVPLAALFSLPAAVPAQSVVDEGSFLLSRDGRPVGTESFTIRRTGRDRDAKIIATGEARIDVDGGEHRLTSALEATGSPMEITAYQRKEDGGAGRSELYMTVAGERFQATLRSPRGEELREFRATPGVVVLGEGLAHHYHFLAARLSGGSVTVPALVPRSGDRLSLRITDAGTERTVIAGRTVQARRLVVQGGGVQREVWIDDEGRVLRVVEEDTGFRAERRDLPG